MSAKLGEILVRENLITSEQLRDTLEFQREHGGRLGSNLVKLGHISDDVVTAVLSRQYGVPSINLDLFQIEKDVIKLISEDVALKYAVLPISKLGATLISKDMAELDRIAQEQKKAEAEAAAQAQADKNKFDAFQAQRVELRLQQRMIKVFAQQRAIDSARAKAALDAALGYGLSIAKDERRRLLQRLPQPQPQPQP